MSNPKIEEHLKIAREALITAQKIADEDSCSFEFKIPGNTPYNVNRYIAGKYYGKDAVVDKYSASELVWADDYHDLELLNPLSPHEEHNNEFVVKEGVWEAWQSSSEEC